MAKKGDKSKEQKHEGGRSPRIVNRKARHDYHILESLECGIELTGTEVKSLRNGQMKLDEAYARVKGGQLYLVGAEIAMYPQAAPAMQHAPTRDRRLLVHNRQIVAIETHVKQKGRTVVPLAVYFHRGWAKVEIGMAVGKREYDKRQSIKDRDQKREILREMHRRSR